MHADLAFLYGSILTDGGDGSSDSRPGMSASSPSAEVGSLADRLGRHRTAWPPCTPRAALPSGRQRVFESIVGSRFTGAVAKTVRCGPHDAIVARVAGRAFYTGRAEFTLEEGDGLGQGFLLR